MAGKMRSALRKCPVLVGMLALIVLPAGAAPKETVLIGVYAGGSFGLGQAFAWHNGGHIQFDYNLTYHLGTYVQYNHSESFGLQLNVNYQRAVFHWTFSYPGMSSEDEKEGVGFLSVDLNGVLSARRVKNAQGYLLAGVGYFNGDAHDGDAHEMRGAYVDLLGGLGVKLFLKRNSRSAVNIGVAFHHLLQLKKYVWIDKADFLRFQAGYEFRLD